MRGQGAEQRPFSHEAVADAFPERPVDPHVGNLLFHRRPIRLPRARDGVAVPIDFGTLRQVSVEVIKAMKKKIAERSGSDYDNLLAEVVGETTPPARTLRRTAERTHLNAKRPPPANTGEGLRSPSPL